MYLFGTLKGGICHCAIVSARRLTMGGGTEIVSLVGRV
jgi:hypothetical protein